METIRLNISLTDKSLDHTIHQLKTLTKYLQQVQKEFIELSIQWLIDRANELLDERVKHFPGTANIKEHWVKEFNAIPNGISAKLINTSEVGAYVEFGTGLVGQTFKHKEANSTGYEYDVNAHGIEGWNWYNQEIGVGMKGFIGYEGKSFLYDAYWEYINRRTYITIYESAINKYMRKIRSYTYKG